LARAVEDPSTALLLKGIVEVGELADVALTLLPVKPSAQYGDLRQQVMPGALRGLVDGVVMHCLPDSHPVVGAVLARRIPAVAIDSPRLPGLPYVTIDHRRAGATQMNHIVSQGHRRIGIVSDRLSGSRRHGVQAFPAADEIGELYLRDRFAGYRDAIAATRIPTEEVAVVEAADIDIDSGMAAVAELMSVSAPTAIVATSDVHAIAALKVLTGLGISVPDRVSVIGFDDAPIANLMGLTTVRQPLVDKGRSAATILLDLIAGHSRRRSVKPTELIERLTTGPAAKG
jgi:DNA-binding LacI/PurR family transcriptional regulator